MRERDKEYWDESPGPWRRATGPLPFTAGERIAVGVASMEFAGLVGPAAPLESTSGKGDCRDCGVTGGELSR